MTNLLEAYGFKYMGICHCTGTRSVKYFRDNYIVYLMPKRFQFRIKKDNSTIVQPSPFKELENALNNLSIPKVPAAAVSA